MTNNLLKENDKVNVRPKYPGIPITTNGNQLVAYFTEAKLADAGIFYPITPSTEQGENFEFSFAKGELNVFGESKIAIETEGEHAAQGGAIAFSVTGKRVVNFTSGQGIVYGLEQYYHAPGKLSTMVLEVAARALTKHALNVHCGHDDIYAAFDTGWIMLMAKDAQQASDQALILRRVTELALTPGMNIQDGFLTSHLERTFRRPEAALMREFLGRADDIIETPTEAQRALFGPTRRRVPEAYNLKEPAMLGTVQNQEHFMMGVAARRHHFVEPVLQFLEESYAEFGKLTGRYYGLISEYNTQDADTVFVSLGSSAENIEAAIDYIKEADGVNVGIIHINVLRPFPEKAVANALKGKKNVIILERTDEQMSGDNPLAREIRTVLSKALENAKENAYEGIPAIPVEEQPRIFSGIYGLGSRDFRPEAVLGAYEYVKGIIARQDGKTVHEGASLFYLGINHPYAVESSRKPSLLPSGSIAVRFHSIGGWGMITTGKNLSEIVGQVGEYIGKRDGLAEDQQAIYVSSNPKYGSEKKGAPTNYFLVMAPERIRVNCDLHNVDVVLCCDPKIFTHTNPLSGLNEHGVFVWESKETDPQKVWERIPKKYRQEIIDKKIKIYTLPGFEIARKATDREDLQLRMQGNAFLGAFFAVSEFLQEYHIPEDEFMAVLKKQYEKKFGKLGEAVVEANMNVMKEGFKFVTEIPYGNVSSIDKSSMRGPEILPFNLEGSSCSSAPVSCSAERTPLFSIKNYDSEYRSGYGYNQPSTPRASTGIIPAATGSTSSKYVARILKPIYIAENCTQCMSCITACPDTALPNTAQDIGDILSTAVKHYTSDVKFRSVLYSKLKDLETAVRQVMKVEAEKKDELPLPFVTIFKQEVGKLLQVDGWYQENTELSEKGIQELTAILEKIPVAYSKVKGIFGLPEKKQEGTGGIFSIFVNDLCKGCGECVKECGDHDALRMVEETEEINADHLTGVNFMNLLPETKQKFLGMFDLENALDSKAATLQYHLMVREKYAALVSGDGACAGCGEKTVLRSLATLTETYMRPVYHKKSDRLKSKANELRQDGWTKWETLKNTNAQSYEILKRLIQHLVMGYGGENLEDTKDRISKEFRGTDQDLLNAVAMVLEQDAVNHKDIQAVEGYALNGMSVMGMTANTGCNTVFGSTHPSNPHPYPWMNSLFQDGTTIGWLVAESFIMNHARRSVIPERLADFILGNFSTDLLDEDLYWEYTHFNDSLMTDAEIQELPKVWAVGGDGGMGDIGFQNLSKVVLQNRPNVNVVMLDTQVYSNTGGQNSDSSVMPGGFDMNQVGAATEGKLTEKKGVSESFLAGHGSPFIAQVSMANSANLYRALLDGVSYRGTAFFQCYTSCQPEHGIPDNMSTQQAQKARDSRCIPEFVFNPQLGESYSEALSLKGNPNLKNDWYNKFLKKAGVKYNYTVAHWAATENRFRRHFFKVKEENLTSMISLDDILLKITQDDVVKRKFKVKGHRAYVPTHGVYTYVENTEGVLVPVGLSRQLVLFCVERRKNWRMLQSKAGVVNEDYTAQKRLLKEYDEGKIPPELLNSKLRELFETAKKAIEENNDQLLTSQLA